MKKFLLSVVAAFTLLPSQDTEAQYYVKQGDTMWNIANMYGMYYSDLLALNPQLRDPNKLRIGQFLTVRDGKKADQVIDYALALQPVTQYILGAENFNTKPYKADCSSWTQHIYRQFGIVLPRVSWEQAHAGKLIPYYEMLQKGDLMFFGSGGKVSHVGIYMGIYNGQPSWISNLGSGKNVKILRLHDKWTQANFLHGARVL